MNLIRLHKVFYKLKVIGKAKSSDNMLIINQKVVIKHQLGALPSSARF